MGENYYNGTVYQYPGLGSGYPSSYYYTYRYSIQESNLDVNTNTSTLTISLGIMGPTVGKWMENHQYYYGCSIVSGGTIVSGNTQYWVAPLVYGQEYTSVCTWTLRIKREKYVDPVIVLRFQSSSSSYASYQPRPTNSTFSLALKDGARPPVILSFNANNSIIPLNGGTNLNWTSTQYSENPIDHYEIKYLGTGGSSSIANYEDLVTTYSTFSSTYSSATVSSSYFPTTRGYYQTFGIKAVTALGVNSEPAVVGIKVNQIPSSPIINSISTNKVVSTGATNIEYSVSPGFDSDEQSYSVWYATSSSGTKSSSIPSYLTAPPWSQASSKEYYFWTYDGLEYSENPTIQVINVNEPPSISNAAWVGTSYEANNTTYSSQYLARYKTNKSGRIDHIITVGTSSYIFNTRNITKSGSYTTPTWYINNYFTDTSDTTSRSCNLKIQLTDDMGETASVSTNVNIAGAPTSISYINNFSNESISTDSSVIYDKIRLLYLKNTEIDSITSVKEGDNSINFVATKGSNIITLNNQDYNYFDITFTSPSFLPSNAKKEKSDITVALNNKSFNRIVTIPTFNIAANYWTNITSSISAMPFNGVKVFSTDAVSPQIRFLNPIAGDSKTEIEDYTDEMEGSFYTRLSSRYGSGKDIPTTISSFENGEVIFERIDLDEAFDIDTFNSDYSITRENTHDSIKFYATPILHTPFHDYVYGATAEIDFDFNKTLTTTLSLDIKDENDNNLSYYQEVDKKTLEEGDPYCEFKLAFNGGGTYTDIEGELQYSLDGGNWTILTSYQYSGSEFNYPTTRSGSIVTYKTIRTPLSVPVDKYNLFQVRAINRSPNSTNTILSSFTRASSIMHISPIVEINNDTAPTQNTNSYQVEVKATWADYGYGYTTPSTDSIIQVEGSLPTGYEYSTTLTFYENIDNIETPLATFTSNSSSYVWTGEGDFGAYKNIVLRGVTIVQKENSSKLESTKTFEKNLTIYNIQPTVSYQPHKLGINTTKLDEGAVLQIFNNVKTTASEIGKVVLENPNGKAEILLEDFNISNFIIDGGSWD